MDTLSPSIFIIPIIVLAIVSSLYLYFSRKSEERHNFKLWVGTIIIVAFLLNFVWELAHGPLYQGFKYNVEHLFICALATLADVLMVLLLFFGFGLLYKDVFWIRKMKVSQVVLLMLVGGLGANFSEMIHLAHGHWVYSNTMPLLPMTDTGATPVLQFTILPWLIFYLCYCAEKVAKLGKS